MKIEPCIKKIPPTRGGMEVKRLYPREVSIRRYQTNAVETMTSKIKRTRIVPVLVQKPPKPATADMEYISFLCIYLIIWDLAEIWLDECPDVRLGCDRN